MSALDLPIFPAHSKSTAEEVPDFQKAFKDFVISYTNLLAEDRPSKVQKVLCETPHKANFAELLDLFWAEGLSREIGKEVLQTQRTTNNNETCRCKECPYQKELIRIENFYDDIFSLGQVNVNSLGGHVIPSPIQL